MDPSKPRPKRKAVSTLNFPKLEPIDNEKENQASVKQEPGTNRISRRLKERTTNLEMKSAAIKTEPCLEEPGLKKSKWEPSCWNEQFELIKQMRSGLSAPVDSMGCDTLSSIDSVIDPKTKRYQCLIALMLSSQTKDEITARAVVELQKLPLNIETILATDEEKIASAIYPAGFYRRKAQYIKKTTMILKEKYAGDIPDSVDELCKLPGVGPKMAYLAMSCAWKKTVGIGVDTHVHRISNRLGWTKKQTKTPEQTRKELEEWMPESLWYEVNHLLVGFGQEICRPVGPKCASCLCRDLCPTGKELSSKPNKSRKKSIKIEFEKDN